ncbi:MAG: hypothetical protein A3J52_00525 [Omnitrophica bacterium RIFCSPHIGHO2_02_FULL_49_9]|nr:MAG: hypothetical protein A3J52_00525 [Omnitrophica bacterium RIFCSPHIGHO2_02_FULL_49_9]
MQSVRNVIRFFLYISFVNFFFIRVNWKKSAALTTFFFRTRGKNESKQARSREKNSLDKTKPEKNFQSESRTKNASNQRSECKKNCESKEYEKKPKNEPITVDSKTKAVLESNSFPVAKILPKNKRSAPPTSQTA